MLIALRAHRSKEQQESSDMVSWLLSGDMVVARELAMKTEQQDRPAAEAWACASEAVRHQLISDLIRRRVCNAC